MLENNDRIQQSVYRQFSEYDGKASAYGTEGIFRSVNAIVAIIGTAVSGILSRCCHLSANWVFDCILLPAYFPVVIIWALLVWRSVEDRLNRRLYEAVLGLPTLTYNLHTCDLPTTCVYAVTPIVVGLCFVAAQNSLHSASITQYAMVIVLAFLQLFFVKALIKRETLAPWNRFSDIREAKESLKGTQNLKV